MVVSVLVDGVPSVDTSRTTDGFRPCDRRPPLRAPRPSRPAQEASRGQFVEHPIAVAHLLNGLGYGEPMLAAAICTMSSRKTPRWEEGDQRAVRPEVAGLVDSWETQLADAGTPEARASRRDRALRRRRGGHLRRRPGDEHARLAQGGARDRGACGGGSGPPSMSAFSSGPRTSRSCRLGADTPFLGDRGGARRPGPRPRASVQLVDEPGSAPAEARPRGRGTPRAVAAVRWPAPGS